MAEERAQEQAVITDVLIVGSGLGGLFSALKASERGLTVSLITKLDICDANTTYAQGGIASKMTPEDTFESHVADTLAAGAGLCDRTAVEHIVRNAPARMQDLIDYGVAFTKYADVPGTPDEKAERDMGIEYDLGKEGGHSARRILHAGDITGRELMRTLSAAVLARPERITVYRQHIAVDLINTRRMGWCGDNVCLGAYVLDRRANSVRTFIARATILATGGAGKVYLYTTNPDSATGDGIAMGWRAFAEIANMEFFQFHPTCLYHPKVKSFLISEALRGEGAVLKVRGKNGEMGEFMSRYHPLRDLAPRDVVARAIDKELKRTGEPCVFLDITHHTEEFLRKRFPNIFGKLLEVGIDMSRQPIPVVPAAHYCCGGVRTDTNACTSVARLYAVGECACTGLHGANRLASNSLLECVVMAQDAVDHIAATQQPHPSPPVQPGAAPPFDSADEPACWGPYIPAWHSGHAVDSDEAVVISHNWDEIRRFMWDYVGIFRTTRRLQRAKHRIILIRREIEQYYWNFNITADLIELRNLSSVAEMIIDSALARKQSVGLHYNADYPPSEEELGKDGKPTKKPYSNWITLTVLRRPLSVNHEYAWSPTGERGSPSMVEQEAPNLMQHRQHLALPIPPVSPVPYFPAGL